jgi:hypothetical protein
MKKIFFVISITLFFFSSNLFSQDDKCNCPQQCKIGKGTIYFTWGYNKDWYTKSSIHFKNHSNAYNPQTNQIDDYDFTLYKMKGSDAPGFDHLLTSQLTIPQYVYRLGYWFNNKQDFGIEINFDHAKYYVDDNQTVHLKGEIRGKYYDTDTMVDANKFMHLQHTNGANFLMLNFMKRQHLLVSKNKKHWLSAVGKLGAGIVIPRSEVRMWGQWSDNYWHVAGYCAGLEVGFRYDFFKYFFIEYTAKGTFANYVDVLTVDAGRANHYFGAFENILDAGIQFHF